MSINKSYAVFGLGRYGFAVATELAKSGADVLAVDIDENIINSAATVIPYCKCADVTDVEVLRQLGISNVDVVIIAMATNLNANVMAIMLCKELGVKTVIAKCSDDMQGKIFTKVGADKVVIPEREGGVRLAKNMLSSGFMDMISLSKDVSIVDIDVKDDWVGKNLIELNLRKKYGFNIVAIKTGDKVDVSIDPTVPLNKEMKLVVIADTTRLIKMK